jgi:uncharacterized protein YbjT (DUF2867 family)
MAVKKSALIIGATGLVGHALLDQLLADDAYGKVVIFVRRSTGTTHAKLVEHVIDFGKPETWAQWVQGDVLFSALGTTRAQAGGTAAQRVVDYDYNYNFAKTAAANGVGSYVLVSSVGADASASAFYMKLKGELDRDVSALPIAAIHILRPGPLDGPRAQPRFAERLFLPIMRGLNAIGIFKSYRPIHGAQVAEVMRKVAFTPSKPAKIHESDDLFRLLSPAP